VLDRRQTSLDLSESGFEVGSQALRVVRLEPEIVDPSLSAIHHSVT